MIARTPGGRRVTPFAVTLVAVALAIPIALAALFATSLHASGAESPEALLRRAAELLRGEDYGGLWDLHDPSAQAEFEAAVDGIRRTVARNPDPGNAKLVTAQYFVSVEEFFSMSYLELFARNHAPYRRVMEGLEILEVLDVLAVPGDYEAKWRSDSTNVPHTMRCRRGPDGRFYLLYLHR